MSEWRASWIQDDVAITKPLDVATRQSAGMLYQPQESGLGFVIDIVHPLPITAIDAYQQTRDKLGKD
jgi:hypothetical protein